MKIQTEAGDQTQYLAHEFNDNTIRFIIKYSGLANAQILQRAAEILVRRIDILHSSFHVGISGTKWVVNEDYPTEGLTIIRNISGDVVKAAKEAALHAIDYSGRVQIRCYLFSNESESALVFLAGHMCTDGRDAIYLLEKLIEIYRNLDNGGTGENVALKNGSRSIEQCYSEDPKMLSPDLQKLLKSEKEKQIKSIYSFRTEGKGRPCFIECMIPKEDIARCRKLADGCTVNDVVLAAYCRAYVCQMGLESDTPVAIATMMDLRKYIPDGDSDGVANFSGPVSICLPDGIGESFSHTLNKIAGQTAVVKDDKKAGLDAVLAVKKAFGMLPFPLIVRLGKKMYGEMPIGMTNIGNITRDKLTLGNCPADDFLFAGPLKKKPALQLSVNGLDGDVRLCIISECTAQDQIQLEELLQRLVFQIKWQSAGKPLI